MKTRSSGRKSLTPGRLLTSASMGVILGIVVGLLGATAMSQNPKASAAASADLAAGTLLSTAPADSLTTQSTAGEILSMMRDSPNRWATLDVIAETTWLPGSGDQQIVHTDLAVSEGVKVNLHTLQHDAKGGLIADESWVTNGEEILQGDMTRAVYTLGEFPSQFRDSSSWTPSRSNAEGVVVAHPMALLVPSKLAQYIFPAELTQQVGSLKVEGTDEVAGRTAVVVTVEYIDVSKAPAGRARYWIDATLGLVLRAQQWVPGDERMYQETIVKSLQLDRALDAKMFSVDVADPARLVTRETYYGAP